MLHMQDQGKNPTNVSCRDYRRVKKNKPMFSLATESLHRVQEANARKPLPFTSILLSEIKERWQTPKLKTPAQSTLACP